MKLMKSLLLGSAAGLCAVAGAQAADLPMRKAAPVEYVRVCTAYGAGFFYIPGTDTCLRVGGRARMEYQFVSNRTRNNDQSGVRALGRLNLDARTQTAYGTLRTFVRFDIASRTGGQLTSGTQQRYSNAFPGLGVDTFGRQQKFVDVDKAFIQFAGITAGRTQSFFDFYAHDLEFMALSSGSDANTNLLAYTATFGGGFSASLAMEDPTFRRFPTFSTSVLATVNGANPGSTPTGSTNIFLGQTAVSGIALTRGPTGLPTSVVNLDVVQRNYLPDFVGALRYDQAWGSAQVSGAVHELRTGNYTGGAFGVNGAFPAVFNPVTGAFTANPGLPAANTFAPKVPDAQYGFAVQGGLKFNLPQIAPGDVLWLQAAYGKGATSYVGIASGPGSEIQGTGYTNRFGGFNVPGFYDMAVTNDGATHLTEGYSGTVSFLHYWTPEWRQAIFGSFARNHFDKALRGINSPLNTGTAGVFTVTAGGLTGGTAGGYFSGFGKDFNNVTAGTNLIWSPVRDLDIGVEALYQRLEFLGGASRGQVIDANKNFAPGGVPRTVSVDDQVLVRMRVQRDF